MRSAGIRRKRLRVASPVSSILVPWLYRKILGRIQKRKLSEPEHEFHDKECGGFHNGAVKVAMSKISKIGDDTRLNRRVRLFPIIFFMVYLNLTVLLFAFGPWDYHLQNPVEFYAFLIAAHGTLLAGYLSAAFREPHAYDNRWSIKKIIFISVILNLLLLIPTSM